MAELLIEILSEEIPARMQVRVAEEFQSIIMNSLSNAGLVSDSNKSSSYVSPRRLVVVVNDLPTKTPHVSSERKGPRVGAPQKAINGFLGSLGLQLKDLHKRKTKKGEFYFVDISNKGQETSTILKELMEDAISRVNWPKSMRWANNKQRWVRPIHSLICIFDNEIVPVSYGSSVAGRKTAAHRFLTNAKVEVSDFADYKKALEIGYVMINSNDRKEKILNDIKGLCKKYNLTLIENNTLLDEVVGLIEWPVVLVGCIDESYMDLPHEVLETTMWKNQKYFALHDSEGRLAPKFIMVANKETADSGASIIAGNERVLRSRLADAKFFWDQDLRTTLASRVVKLDDVTFHAKLGTIGQKVVRVKNISAEIAGLVKTNKKQVVRAAELAKADLVTEMVTEFPEVQGIMGRYYALNDGEVEEVAQAIADHYAPVGPSDFCPKAPISVTLALADKIDTLVGFWAIDEKPTGSKDPYALRRSALGVIRLILENKLRLSLRQLSAQTWAIAGYDKNKKDALDNLLSFFYDRLRVHLRDKGVRHDLITAVFNVSQESDIVQFLERIDVLENFLETDNGINLLSAYRRAVNILRIEEKKDKRKYDNESRIDKKLLSDEIEISLVEKLNVIIPKVKIALETEDIQHAMSLLASLRSLVDDFFDSVTVNSDDPLVRINRLLILSLMRSSFNQVADFSQIEGGER